MLDDAPVAAAPAAPPVQAAAPASNSPAGGAQGTGPARTSKPGSAALLLGDAAGSFLLINEARYRATERAFGIRREDANIATAIGLLVLANAVYERAHRPTVPKPPTAVADLAIGLGALRESIYSVAGPASRDTPLVGSLIAVAIVGGLARQPVSRGLQGVKASSRRLKHAFRGRYGHLVTLGRGD